jgi:hypothetical protein
MPNTQPKSCRWVFTINHQDNGDPHDDCCDPREWENIANLRSFVFQFERAPTSNTLHKQGGLRLKEARNLSWLKKHVCGHAHWEIARGSPESIAAYCSKDETRANPAEDPYWFNKDDWGSKQGTRTDLEGVQEALRSGASLAQVAEEHFGVFLRYSRGIERYVALHEPKRDAKLDPRIYVFWGAPGVGKSRRATWEAEQRFGPENVYYLAPPNQFQGAIWWDGYQGQECVVVDEFYGWIPQNTLLRLLDRQPVSVQVKGGSRQLRAYTWYFTSNKHPDQWWPRTGLDAASQRRFGLGDYQGYRNGGMGETIEMIMMPGGAPWAPPVTITNDEAQEILERFDDAYADQEEFMNMSLPDEWADPVM